MDQDEVLSLLPKDTVVMHDHLKVNYNKAYSFSNVECNAHLLRDLQKIIDNQLTHTWAKELRKCITDTNKARTAAINQELESFDEAIINEFFGVLNLVLLKGIDENRGDDSYYGNEERRLLNRIIDYKDNYFAWVTNFEIPFTNNLSERALRGAKSKMKISGQFQSEEYAGYYAIIKSYIETCYRNGINEYAALRKLCDGEPFTIAEILEVGREKE